MAWTAECDPRALLSAAGQGEKILLRNSSISLYAGDLWARRTDPESPKCLACTVGGDDDDDELDYNSGGTVWGI